MGLLGVGTGEPGNFRDTVLLTEFRPNSQYSPKLTEISLKKYPKIEFHGHLGKYFNTTPDIIKNGINELSLSKFVSLNLASGDDFSKIIAEYNDERIIHFVGIHWESLKKEGGFLEISQILKKDFEKGAKGVKLWKNFGLSLKLKNGERLKMDSDLLEPLFYEIETQRKPVGIHTGDPEAFFSTIDERNERYEELIRHPEWSFSGNSFPKFSELMEERERMFRKYPKVQFIALHFGEFAHRLRDADSLLQNNPNVYLDIAARIDELGRHPKESKEFFLKWQDRILLGMDGPPDLEKLKIYMRFLETEDEYFDYHPDHKPRKGFWKIYGLGLPDTVLRKVYYENAKKILQLSD